jgi:cell division protein FtsI/penicillin-binding protein 2
MPATTSRHPPRRSPTRRGRARAAVVSVLVAAVALAGGAVYLLFGARGPSAREGLDAFAAAWSRGDDAAAARATDLPGPAAAALAANRRGLDGASVRVSVLDVVEDGDAARARLRLEWRVPAIGRFAYATRATLRRGEDAWKVVWRPTIVHPRLVDGRRLGTTVDRPDRADILDRSGRALVTDRAVVRVGVARNRVRDVEATARAVAEVVDVDAGAYARAIRRAGPQQFVEAVTLRAGDLGSKRAALEAIEGVQTVQGRAPLAPTRGFARALLGTVGPATAEQLERLGPAYGPGASVGQFGLQARFETRLAGTPSRSVITRLPDGTADETLLERRGRAGLALRTTLDRDVQAAAEAALGDRDDEAALVAVKPSTGDILAVANRPSDSSFDRALGGRYPPGSTFKVISTTALLRDGLRPEETVECPARLTVEGKAFRNFEGGAAGAVPFTQDFAQSCNTAFVSLASRLAPDALGRAARAFGLGREVTLPLDVAASQVPPGRTRVERAAAMIGQDRILASPLAMAGVAATVADGRWRAPRLVSGDARRAGTPLGGAELATLRTLMRRVVVGGTGTALAGVPGEVAGKSGTAEFGSGDPPPTHAWFIALRGDVAVAVLVERGASGGRVAAPIAARFLGALGGG